MNAIVRLTEHGIVMPREVISGGWPIAGVICSMAWQFTGDRLRIVWFNNSARLQDDIRNGIPMKTRAFMSYARTKACRARRAREHRGGARG